MTKKDKTVDCEHDEDTEGWLSVAAKLSEQSHKNREKRITEWATLAGPPHAEVFLGDDPQYVDRIGFWRVRGGLIRIRASRRGEFDPAVRTEFTTKEINAITDAFGHPVIKEKE